MKKWELSQIDEEWDLVVAGGGITGAGIFREAVRAGLKVLLVEAGDFASGTSSRSSKLVHGGLRYLKEGRFFLTRESVKEREKLLSEAPGLVEPLDFMLPIFKGRGPSRWVMKAGLTLYDIIAGKLRHRFLSKSAFMGKVPLLTGEGLTGGFIYMDAQVDDARLVMRLISEAEGAGAGAMNYTRLSEVLRAKSGEVTGVVVKDSESGEVRSVKTKALINATGAWAEGLHKSPVSGLHLRPLKGSHMVFSQDLIPVSQAVSFFHPADGRPLFVLPWEGVSVLGTTDIDYDGSMDEEPAISIEEAEYMIEGLKSVFPGISIGVEDCISSFSGVRPVLSEGKLDPSKETREHVVWEDKGLVTIAGGKLTTFRVLAQDTLKVAQKYTGARINGGGGGSVFDILEKGESVGRVVMKNRLSSNMGRRLCGRYGKAAMEMIGEADSEELERIPGTPTLWVELRHAAGKEKVRHLTDLMLRRVRIGLLLADGGERYLEKVKAICEPELLWGEERWDDEIRRYLSEWHRLYGVKGAVG